MFCEVHASAETLLDAACSAPEACSRVMLVAHNPGIEDFVSQASGRLTEMPTGTLAVFTTESTSWSELGREAMSLAIHQRPRELSD